MTKRVLITLSVLSGVVAFGLMWLWAWIEHLQPKGDLWWGGVPLLFTIFGCAIGNSLLAFAASNKER